MATGYDFHLTLIDLPLGTYRLMWETQHAMVDQMVGADKEFLVAIDDVVIFDVHCNVKRKFQPAPPLIMDHFTVQQYHQMQIYAYSNSNPMIT